MSKLTIAPESVARALSMVNQPFPYILGAGGYVPGAKHDVPWGLGHWIDAEGRPHSEIGAECSTFAMWCHKITSHRPGFNRGPWATVSDDVNPNSAIEDARHKSELFELVTGQPEPGDLACYPTIHLQVLNAEGVHETKVFIGHVMIAVDVVRAAGQWDPEHPDFSLITFAHCHGGNGRIPGVTIATGDLMNLHSERWPKEEHRSRLLRVKAGDA